MLTAGNGALVAFHGNCPDWSAVNSDATARFECQFRKVIEPIQLDNWQKLPVEGINMDPLDDCFKMQVASRRGSCRAHTRNHLAYLDRLTLSDGAGIQMVIRCDDPVAVVDFDAIATAPGMPPNCSSHSCIRGINTSPAP
jgi:hypothetical protein